MQFVQIIYHGIALLPGTPEWESRHEEERRASYADYAAAPTELDELEEALWQHDPYHATRAELLRVVDPPVKAGPAGERGRDLTNNPAEPKLLRQRVDRGRHDEVCEYVLAP
jgi:hypothetical protein